MKRKKPKATAPGRRRDIPWREIRALYVEGEKVEMPDKTFQHRWPSFDDLSERFNVDRNTIGCHSAEEGWVQLRADFQQAVEEADRRRRAAVVVGTVDAWGEKAKRYEALVERQIAEISYAYDWHQQGHADRAAALRRRSPSPRPGGGDHAAQGIAPPEGEDTSTTPAPRAPMPPRDQKDLAAALGTSLASMRMLIFGAPGQSQTPLTNAGGKGPDAEGADPSTMEGTAEVVTSFVQFLAARNRTPQKDPA